MKRRMRKYTAGILLAAILCITAGCGSLQYDGQDPADTENEVSEETEYQPESQSPEPTKTSEPTRSPEPTKSPELTRSPEPTKSPEPEAVEETACPSEEEIAALGIREDMLAYWLVLNNKKPFVSVNEDGQSFFWDQYFWFMDCLKNNNDVYTFMVLDMDGDGKEEVVLETVPGTTDILHYEDGRVYGYRFGGRSMKRIHENSIFEASGGASVIYYFKLTELNKDGYEYELLAEMYDDYYEVEGEQVTEEKYLEYEDSIESVELAECMDYTDSMLEQRLLGELQEQEAALVRRIPAEKMVENEPDYQIHKEALQLYARVLSGKEEAIYVKGHDYWQWEDEPIKMYFSLIDLDGDGVCELVFSCYFCTFQILHYRDGKAYCYQFHPEDTVITTDGTFHSKDGYAKIEAFEEDGCRLKLLEDYDRKGREWVRYYYYSEDTMAQWLAEPEAVEETACPSEEEIAALGIREDMLAYWLVLNNKKPFVSVNEDGQSFFWDQYFWFIDNLENNNDVYTFMVLDMDGDGKEEVVLETVPGTTDVLHYEDGTVYGYRFGIRAMARIRESGIYEGSDGASGHYYLRLTKLTKEGYEEETLAEIHGDHYEVEGKEVTEEKYIEYADSIESVELAERTDYTESMLEQRLLGELQEQEAALVRRIPAEKMVENEPDYQIHKEALQLYAKVLSGEEEAIYIKTDDWQWEDEPTRMYFSLIDLDGDGVCELVFSCYFWTFQILHYRDGKVYCYEFHPGDAVITTDGVFNSWDGYAKIEAFEEDGCRLKLLEDYDRKGREWVRYYYYSEDTMAQWLAEPKAVEEAACPSEEEIAALGIREDMLAYWLVLNNKKPFVSVNEDGQSFFWDQYFWFMDCLKNNNDVYTFMVLDMDGDGKEEVVLETVPGTTDILHYEDGTVYGYRVGLRAMKRIHENGIYEGSDGASVVHYYKLTELNKDGYEYEMLAEMNDDYYEVEGKEVTEEKYIEYADSIESVELAECIDYTDTMLEQRLLGELQEQEAALVRRIPAEKMVENEPDYQIHKEALQLYAKILSGEEEAIYVKGYDYWQWEDELTRMYFSLIDLDGDGVCELVFSCYFCTFQILHYRDGKAYCYQFHPEDTVITTDGVFHSKDGYAKIEAFEEDGCRLKLQEDYDRKGREWVRYYYYSEDTMSQWLAEPEGECK